MNIQNGLNTSSIFKKFDENREILNFLNFWAFLFTFTVILFFISGCSQKPQVIVKYKYIEKPCPKLQIINLDELNLNPDKPLKFNFKIKNKGK